MEAKVNGKGKGVGRLMLIILGLILLITLIVVAVVLATQGHPQATPSPTPNGGGGSLPTCADVQRTCRKKCINKWWIPVVGITQYQKCMDGCIVDNPCA